MLADKGYVKTLQNDVAADPKTGLTHNLSGGVLRTITRNLITNKRRCLKSNKYHEGLYEVPIINQRVVVFVVSLCSLCSLSYQLWRKTLKLKNIKRIS